MELNDADYAQLGAMAKKNKAKYGDKLYHYTSFSNFFNMIKSREIWMTSTGSMNDKKETTYFIERIEKELNSYNRKEFFENIYTQISKNYKYAFCLSTERDDAAQWERYGDGAKGICLAFNVEELCKCLYGYQNIVFNKIFYNESVTEEAYFKEVKNYFETGKIENYASEAELIEYLIHTGNLHKHKSFKNEHEIRITTFNHKGKYGAEYELKELGNVVKKVFILKPDIMGHSKKTNFDFLIDEVIIGPRSQQNDFILGQYLYSKGLRNMANKVTVSECPLR